MKEIFFANHSPRIEPGFWNRWCWDRRREQKAGTPWYDPGLKQLKAWACKRPSGLVDLATQGTLEGESCRINPWRALLSFKIWPNKGSILQPDYGKQSLLSNPKLSSQAPVLRLTWRSRMGLQGQVLEVTTHMSDTYQANVGGLLFTWKVSCHLHHRPIDSTLCMGESTVITALVFHVVQAPFNSCYCLWWRPSMIRSDPWLVRTE